MNNEYQKAVSTLRDALSKLHEENEWDLTPEETKAREELLELCKEIDIIFGEED